MTQEAGQRLLKQRYYYYNQQYTTLKPQALNRMTYPETILIN